MQDYTNQDLSSGNKKKSPIVYVLIACAALGFMGLICCGGLMFFGFNEIQNIEKTYYEECDAAVDDLTCNSCCSQRGHNGHIYGELFNDPGQTCGCL